MRRGIAAAATLLALCGPVMVGAQTRPESRPLVSQAAAVSPDILRRPDGVTPAALNGSEAGFQAWLQGFRARARTQGISNRTLDAALAGVRFSPDVIVRDRNQSEFTKQLWEYLDSAVSPSRIANGQAAMRENRAVLQQIEAKYGVEAEVVVAVWGLESSYGSQRGTTPTIQSLATLAYEGRRGAFFEEQLIAALKIVQSGDVSAQRMTGSWAGAMGHTQFIPTSYLVYAVDFTGDGKRDIWSDNPADALASTAAYLKKSGWTKGQPWGVEVRLPKGFDYASAGRQSTKPVDQWNRLGVRDMAGQAVPDYGRASILLPAGAAGPALMTFDNFTAIEHYNAADAYVIAVGHLSDRIGGAPDFQAAWPRSDKSLKRSERVELQERLTARGYNTQGADGLIGPNTLNAIRSYQQAAGMIPDGYASMTLLVSLR